MAETKNYSYSNSTLNTTTDSIFAGNKTENKTIINETTFNKTNNTINKLNNLNSTNTTDNKNTTISNITQNELNITHNETNIKNNTDTNKNNTNINNTNIDENNNKNNVNNTKKNNMFFPPINSNPYNPNPSLPNITKIGGDQISNHKNDSHIFNGIILGAMFIFVTLISVFIYCFKKKKKNKTKQPKIDINQIAVKNPSSDRVNQKEFHVLQNTSSVSDTNVAANNSLNEIKILNNINQNLGQEINNIINSSGSSSSSGRRRRDKKKSSNSNSLDQNKIEKEIKDQIKQYVIDEHAQ